MEELLSVDVEDDTIDIPGPSQPAESGADLALQLRQATEREAEVRASLAEATDAQTKVEALLQRMDAERDGLYAEIDEAGATVVRLEEELRTEREGSQTAAREKLGVERQLGIALDELEALKTELAGSGASTEGRARSPRFAELTSLAADDAIFQMQLKELESELQAAHGQLAVAREELKRSQSETARLQAKLERLDNASAEVQAKQGQQRVAADIARSEGLVELEEELVQSNDRLRVAAEENGRLRDRVVKLEKLQEVAKSGALKAEKELQALRAAAEEAAARQQADTTSRNRQQQQLERRLEAAEVAHERARSDLAEKDSTIRELESAASELGTARPISAEPADSSDGTGRGKSRGKGGPRSEWLAAEEGYRTEIASLKHEVHQVRIKLRHMTAKKSTREHELEETVKRLGRRSKLHEGVAELSSQLSQAQSETSRMRIELESLQLEKDHVAAELRRKTGHAQELERQLASMSKDDAVGQSMRKADALMEENKRLDDLLQAAQLEFQQRDEQDRQRQFQLEELPSIRRQLKDKQAEVVQQQLAEEASQEKIVALEQSLENIRAELSESQRRLFVCQQEAATRSTEDASRHAKEVCAAEQRVRERDNSVDSLQNKLGKMGDEARQLRAALQAAEEMVSTHSSNCETRVSAAVEETDRIRREACHCVSENERLHSIIEDKSKQIGLLQESFDVLNDGNEESVQQQVVLLVAQLEHSSAAQSELERRLADMQGALQGQVIELTSLQREASSILSKLGTANAELSAARKVNRDRDDEVSTMRLDFTSLQRELEEAQSDLELQTQRATKRDDELSALQAEVAEQRQRQFEKENALRGEHDSRVQALKLRILELEHDGENRLPLTDGPGNELLSELKGIAQQVQDCCTQIAESGTKDLWCSRVDALLESYEGAVLSQAKAMGVLLVKNQELLTQSQCTTHTMAAMDNQLQQAQSKLGVMTRKVDTVQSQLDQCRSADKHQQDRLAAVLTDKIEALTVELGTYKEGASSSASANDRLKKDAEMLQQQLAKSRRDLAVATAASEAGNAGQQQGGDTEERISRLREFFEAEVSKMVTARGDGERLREMSQQLAASKIMEDDLRMSLHAVQQQKDVLLTDAVVLKDVIRALEADLTSLQAAQGSSSTTNSDFLPAAAMEYQTTIAELRTDAEVERQRAGQLKTRLAEAELQMRQKEEEIVALKHQTSLRIQQTEDNMHKARQEELAGVKQQQFEHKSKQAEEVLALQSELERLRALEGRGDRSITESMIAQSITSTSITAEQLDADLETTRREYKQLVATNEKLVEQLAESRAEIAASATTVAELESALSTLGTGAKNAKASKKKKVWSSNDSSSSAAAMGRKYAVAQANLANAKRQLRLNDKRERELQRQLHDRDVRIEELQAQALESETLREEADKSTAVVVQPEPVNAGDDESSEADSAVQDLHKQLSASESALKESKDRVGVLTKAVEQLSAQLHDVAPQANEVAGRSARAPPRRSSGYGQQGAKATKAKAIEVSQRMVIDGLRTEVETLREQVHQLENSTLGSARTHTLDACFGNMRTVAMAVAGITPLLALVTPPASETELTETETILQNISTEFATVRTACDAFAELDYSPGKRNPDPPTTVSVMSTPPPRARHQGPTEDAVADTATPNRAALAGLKRKVVELESQIGELSAAHEKAQRQAREGSVRYDNLSADHRQLKRKLESAELLQSELQESAESRDATLAELKTSKRQLLHRVEQLQKALVAAEELASSTPADATAEKQREERIEQLEAALSQQKSEAEDTAVELRVAAAAAAAEAEDAAAELRKALDAAEAEAGRLREDAQASTASAERAAEAARDAVGEHEAGVQGKLQALMSQAQQSENDMQLKQAELEGVTDRADAIQRQHDQLLAKLEATEERCAAAEDAAAAEAKEGEGLVEGLRAQLEAVQTQLEGARAECGSLRKLIEQKEKELSVVRDGEGGDSLASLREHRAELQQKLEDAETARSEQAAVRLSLESTLRKQTAKAEKWKTRQKAASKKLTESRAECQGLRDQLRGASERLSAARKQNEKAVRTKKKQGVAELTVRHHIRRRPRIVVLPQCLSRRLCEKRTCARRGL